MATVNGTSSSFYNSYGVKNKGLGGLASGLDTDSLVEALTYSTRSKIAAQGQKKQLLNWKVTAYRTMATALNAYKDKYLSNTQTSNKTNLMSNTFFNTYKATSSSDKVSVTANSGSLIGDFSIDRVAQLASAATLTNKTQLSTDLTLGVDFSTEGLSESAFNGRVLQLDLDGSVKNIKLDTLSQYLVSDGNGGYKLDESQKADVVAELNRLTTEAFGTKNIYNADGSWKETVSKVQVSLTDDGKIKLDSDASKISVYSDCDALGVIRGKTNRVDMSTKLGAIDAFSGVQGDVLSFAINGTEITVTKNDTLATLKSKIESSTAGVRFDYNQYTDEFILTAKSTGAGNTIDIQDTQGNLMNTLFGATSNGGVGTNFLMSKEPVIYGDGTVKLWGEDVSDADRKRMAQELSSLEFSLTIDGVTKTVKADITDNESLSTRISEGTVTSYDILTALNKGIQNAFSGTSVRFTIDSATGKVAMANNGSVAYAATATTSGSRNALEVLGVSGAIGNTVLDMGYSNTITAANEVDPSKAIKAIGGNISGTFDLTINGETKQIEVFSMNAGDINDAIKKAFGSDVAKKVSFYNDEDGKLALKTTDTNMAINISQGVNIGDKVDIYEALGFAGTAVNNTNPGGGISFDDLMKGDQLGSGTLTFTLADGSTATVDYGAGANLQDFLAEINDKLGDPTAASIVNGRLSIKSANMTGISDDGNMLELYFGVNGGSFEAADKSYGEGKFVAGKDAEIVVNGKTLSYSSNTFTMNGVTVTVNAESAVGDRPINVSVKSDPDDVIDRLKGWIDDYNGMISALNSMIYENTAKGYTPLTDEQKAEMTDDQIKTWETEAKKGILRNDKTLAKIVSDLREGMYQKVEAAGISLYDIGITTKAYSYTDLTQSGHLVISDEDKLREMLTNDPDKVRLLFTDPSEGLASRMNNIITAATNPSSISRGSLIRLAGTESLTGDNSSVLGKQIDQIDKLLSTLATRLETEHNRYWKQFTALETAIQKMNAQSSWLTQS